MVSNKKTLLWTRPYTLCWLSIPFILAIGLLYGQHTLDFQLHDTYYVIAIWHFAIAVAIVLWFLGVMSWAMIKTGKKPISNVATFARYKISKMENSAQLLEDSLMVIWNDRNPERRLQAMETVYAANIHFYESDNGPAIVGYQQMNEVISNLQAQWPLEFAFEITRPASANHQVQHIAWNLGIPGQAPAAKGMDVAIIKDGKIESLHLFLDGTQP